MIARPCVIGAFVLLALTLSVRAQAPPLVGPVLAVNTVERDAILLYDVGDATVRRLSFGPQAHHVWDFTAEGCRVVLTLGEGGAQPGQLVSARLDGRDVRPLVRYDELPPEAWGVWEPDASPDGSRIAFTMIRDQAQANGDTLREHHIAWVPPEGGAPTFYSVTGREFAPRWSPDGSQLAYISYDERPAGADIYSTAVPTLEPAPGQAAGPDPVLLNEADLWQVSADGQTKTRKTAFSTGSVSKPRWSPDGALIAFVYSPSGNNDTFWMIGAQPGARPTQLNFQWGLILALTWLPDSTAILGAARDFRGISENRLWQIPLVGNADETAFQYLSALDLRHADYPRFSAEGRYLALRSHYAVWLVDVTTQQARRVEALPLDNSPPVWSPAGFAGESACP